ncbi:MAG: MFS transporter, partial [Clostridia bacterium]|nr:MFS transporter [Clostridia bacterium]
MRLNVKRTVLIGLAFMSILSFWQMYDQVIPYILENIFSLSTLQANSIMSIDNILAIFMLPLFGALSDKTKTPLGKRTPYILFGTILASLLLVLLGVFSSSGQTVPFLIVLFLLLFTMSTYRTPAVAYMPDVTPKPLRSKGNAIINLVGYIGGIFSTILMMFLLKSSKNEAGETVYDAGQSFLPLFIIIAAFMLICVLILVFTVRENKLLKETGVEMSEDDDSRQSLAEKNSKLPKDVFKSLVLILLSVFLWFMAYNAVTTAFSRYCVEILGSDLGTSSGYLLTATVAAIAAFVPLGHLSDLLGRKKTVLLGITAMTVCYAVAIFLRSSTPLIYLLFAIVGIGWAAINVNSF